MGTDRQTGQGQPHGQGRVLEEEVMPEEEGLASRGPLGVTASQAGRAQVPDTDWEARERAGPGV